MVLTCCRQGRKLGRVFRKMPLYQTHTYAVQNSSLSFSVKWVELAQFLPDFPDLQGVAPHRFRRAGSGPSSVPGDPDIARVELWDGRESARSCLASFQLWALTLSFSCKVWLMEDDTPRGRESISLASVANGLDNRGAELLESLVCPLPHPGLPPTPTWWEGPLFTILLPPLSPPHLFGEHLGTTPSEPLQGFDLPSPPSAQSSLLHPLGNICAHPPRASTTCPCWRGQGMAPPGSDI